MDVHCVWRSTSEDVQAPVARIVSSASNSSPEEVVTPMTLLGSSGEKSKDLTSAVMKETRPELSTCFFSQTIDASASAHPLLLFRYPKSPVAPPVLATLSMSSREDNSTIAS